MYSKTTDLNDFINLLSDSKILFPPRVFLATDEHFIYTSLNKDWSRGQFTVSAIDSIIPFSFSIDRWKMLDTFSKFEFLISQIIFALLNPTIDVNFFDKHLMKTREWLLDSITIENKIKIIENYFNIKIWKTKNLFWIRNQLAHSINCHYIEYNEKNLKENIDTFKEDVFLERTKLIWLYHDIRPSKDIVEKVTEQIDWVKKQIIES